MELLPFKKIESIGFLDERMPNGAKSLILHHLSLKKRILLRGEEENILKIKDEVETLNPEVKVLLAEEGVDPKRFDLILAKKDFPLSYIVNVSVLTLSKGKEIMRERLINVLEKEGYERVSEVESEKEYRVQGALVDFFILGDKNPVRIEFFGDTIYDIRYFDPMTQRTVEKADRIEIPFREGTPHKIEAFEIEERDERYPVQFIPNPPFIGNFDIFKREVVKWHKRDYRIFYIAKNRIRYSHLKERFPFMEYFSGDLYQGFICKENKTAFYTEGELYGFQSDETPLFSFGEKTEDLLTLEMGKPVIHEDYGVGYFKGVSIYNYGIKFDTFEIQFKENQRVFTPFYALNRIERYVGEQNVSPTGLGGERWFKKKLKARASAHQFAKKHLETQAYRRTKEIQRNIDNSEYLRDVIESFPYRETEDQEKAWEEVKKDLMGSFIMDRLVIGDVGFGKTEIALRSAVLTASGEKQVCVLVPTTTLAIQHYLNFTIRLKNTPFIVASLSRLKKEREVQEIIGRLSTGEIDIVIGTHRLLQDDVKFNNLGLLIVDEEHRFGVEHKEKIKFIKKDVDTLYLSATPIPRTLYFSLSKIYKMSMIETPPPSRKEVETLIAPYSSSLIQKAVERELVRGGQVFYVLNRISELKRTKEKLISLFPDTNIDIVHGRMKRDKMEEVFVKFLENEIDILVTTSILEVGVDFPNANTLIVEKPHLFGLAELHQLRGRVGRSTRKAYAYFLVPKNIGQEAKRRLKALATYRHLGSGFKIALYDMKLRGIGNILGKEQHGFIKHIGYSLYMKILNEEILRLKGKERERDIPEIVLQGDCYIPREYIDDEEVITAIYRKLMDLKDKKELLDLYQEIRDRFGPLPDEVKKLFLLGFVLTRARKEGINKITVFPTGVGIETEFIGLSEWDKIFSLNPS